MDWKERLIRELAMAREARKHGNEGLARVCARRASGWAIQQYLLNDNVDLETPSAFEYIKHFRENAKHEPKMQAVLDHLVQRKVKDSLDGDSYWPLKDVDLIDEAEWLVHELLGDLKE